MRRHRGGIWQRVVAAAGFLIGVVWPLVTWNLPSDPWTGPGSFLRLVSWPIELMTNLVTDGVGLRGTAGDVVVVLLSGAVVATFCVLISRIRVQRSQVKNSIRASLSAAPWLASAGCIGFAVGTVWSIAVFILIVVGEDSLFDSVIGWALEYPVVVVLDWFGFGGEFGAIGLLLGAPLVGLFWGAIGVLLTMLFRLARRFWRPRRGQCANCGYDLRGTPGRPCPECGKR